MRVCMYVCMHVGLRVTPLSHHVLGQGHIQGAQMCIYVLCADVGVYVHVCVYVCMYACMHVGLTG